MTFFVHLLSGVHRQGTLHVHMCNDMKEHPMRATCMVLACALSAAQALSECALHAGASETSSSKCMPRAYMYEGSGWACVCSGREGVDGWGRPPILIDWCGGDPHPPRGRRTVWSRRKVRVASAIVDAQAPGPFRRPRRFRGFFPGVKGPGDTNPTKILIPRVCLSACCQVCC